MPQAEWDSSSEEESSSEESSSEESFDDEASESESESGSEEDSSEYSSDSGADESMESGDDEYFGDEEKGSRGNLFNEPSGNPKWTKFVPSKIVDKGLSYAAIFCFCICFIPLALIIGLSVGLTVGRGDDGDSTKAPTPAPTMAPNVTPPPMAALFPTVAPTETPTEAPEPQIKGVLLTAEASNTIYRTGANVEVSAGEEGVMLVQNAPPGDTELDSAYSLVQFDGILGVDSSLSVDEFLESIEGLAMDFCLTIAEASNQQQDYTTCLLSPDSATNIADLSGSTAPAYSIPDDCLNGQVVTFSVLPGVDEVCVDIGPLLSEASNLRRRRRMQGANVTYLLMIDALEESDQRGTGFYSSADTEGRAPSLTIQGTNTCPAKAVLDVLVADTDSFSSVVAFATLAGLAEPLACLPNITLFAPDNDAFTKLAETSPVLVGLLQGENFKEHLQNLIKYHLVLERLSSADIAEGLSVPTASGDSLSFSVNKNNKIFVNGQIRVDSADKEADNGVVHLIEDVLLPAWVKKNIADVIAETPSLATINDFIAQANLAGILSQPLSNETVYTVFAPTNTAIQGALAAFAGIGIDDSDTLSAILTQHIVPGVYSASALESVDILGSALGTNLTFVTAAGTTTVNGINITSSDILANNGIVHLIDGVLLPPTLLPGGGMVVGDGPSISMPIGGDPISMPVGGDPGTGAATQSCSICSGAAGMFKLNNPNNMITIPEEISLTTIQSTEATCTILEQACQLGACVGICSALAATGASETCGCEPI